MLKNFKKVNTLIFATIFLSPLTILAVEFKPLVTDNPFIIKSSGLAEFLNNLYKIGISLASVLAIVMIFYAGFIYTTSSSSSGKQEAKQRIQAALGGLFLALSSYIILRSINPQLVYINLGFNNISQTQITAEILTEEGRQAIAERLRIKKEEETAYQAAIDGATASSGGSTGGSSGSTGGSLNNVPQPVFNGSTYVSGENYIDPAGTDTLKNIPTKGQFNKTQQQTQGGDGIEPHTTSVVFKNTLWGRGNASWFGGPTDTSVSENERTSLDPNILLKKINTDQLYVALRFDYSKLSKAQTKGMCVEVYSISNRKSVVATPLDWGPHSGQTDKSIDISPGLSRALGYKKLGDETDEPLLFRLVKGGCSPIQQ